MADEVASLVVKITGDASGLSRTISQAGKELDTLEKKSDRTADKIDKAGKSTKAFGDAIDDVTKPAQVAAAAILAGGVASAKFAMDFESNMAGVARVSNISGEELERLKDGIIDISQTTPSTTAELTSFAEAGGRLIKNTDGLLEFSRVMAELGVATDMSGSQAAESMAQFANLTGMADNDFRRLGSTVVALGNNFVTGESKIMDMAQRLGAAGKAVGMTEADILGLSAALSSLGLEPDAGGSAISTILMEIETLVGKGEGFEVFAEAAEMSADKFKEAWDEDATGTFLTFLEKLGQSPNIAGVLSELGIDEIRQRDAVMRLAQSFGVLDSAITTSNQAWRENTALQNEFATQASTTEAQMQIAKNNIVEAGRSIGESLLPFVEDGAVMIADLAEGIADMSEESRENLLKVGTAIVGIGAGGKVLSGVTKTLGDMGKAIAAIGKALPAGALAGGGVAAGLGALTVGTMAGIKTAAESWKAYQADWSRGGEELSEEINGVIWELNELKSVSDEVGELELIIRSPKSSTEEVNAAKARLEEIRSYLAEKYGLDINVPVEELDTAIQKLILIKKLEDRETITEAEEYLTGREDDYTAQKATSQAHHDTKADYEEQMKAAKSLNATIAELTAQYENGEISAEQYYEQTRQAVKGAGTAVEQQYLTWMTSAEKIKEQFDEGYFAEASKTGVNAITGRLNEVDAAIAESEGYIAEYQRMAKSVAEYGLAEIAVGDFDSGIARINTALSYGIGYAGNWAQAIAAVQSGVADASAAMSAGGEVLSGYIQNYLTSGKELGMTSEELSIGAALLANGFTDLNSAAEAGALQAVYADFAEFGAQLGVADASLAAFVQQYIGAMQAMGMSSEEIALNAALLQNGFATVADAAASADLGNVVGDLQSLGGQLGLTSDEVAQLAYGMGLIPEDMHIEIDAEGNLSVVENTKELAEEMDGKRIAIHVEADGENAYTVINGVEYAIDGYDEKTGTAKLYAEDGVVVAVVDVATGRVLAFNEAKGTATLTASDQTGGGVSSAQKSIGAVTNSPHVAVITASDQTESGIAQARSRLQSFVNTPWSTKLTVRVASPKIADIVTPEAKGTTNFPGGLAVINDQRGIPDPRELVIHNNKGYIFEGRDVVVPLDKGDKVYTAAETKRMLPHLAGGQNNSDAFTAAREDWDFYTSTHAVTTTQELEKWVQLSKEFLDNQQDVRDIEREIYGLTRDVNDELNETSLSYIETHAAMNDWADIGDDPLSAWERVRERNLELLNEGKLTWEEYSGIIAEAGETAYSARLDQSYDWLEHEREYNDMSADDYLAGLDRMRAYTQEYYEKGLIDHRTYRESMSELDDKYIDGVRENLETLNENSLDWISDRASSNDWDKYADDPVQAFIRIRNRNLEAFNAGDITWDMYHDNLADTGSEIVSAVDDAFMEALNISRDYLGMSDREFLQSLDERWEMVDEFYRNGMLSETEYGEYMQEIAADRYDAASEIYADMLDDTRSRIDSINEFYSDKISGLQDAWETGDRAEDMAETREQMEVFEGAVTAQGMRQYEEYAQQLRELERDEEIYRLEQEQATALDALEYEYTRIEEEQSDALRAIYTATENASALAERMINAVETGFRETVSAVASSAQNISNYADNRNINITAADDTALTAFLRKFSWLGGMLS